MTGFRLTRLAANDLLAIWEYLAEDSGEQRADRILADLSDVARKLAEHPGMGHRRTDLSDETLRVWTVHSYLVIYRPEQDPIEIVRVVHGSRDLLRLFR